MTTAEAPTVLSSASFFDKLEARVAAVDSLLCVGLDPHSKELFPNGMEGITEEMHADAAFTFCKTLIDATGACSCVLTMRTLLFGVLTHFLWYHFSLRATITPQLHSPLATSPMRPFSRPLVPLTA